MTLLTGFSAQKSFGHPNEATIVSSINGQEPFFDGQFFVSLSSPSPTDTLVFYIIGGSAAAGIDYSGLLGIVTIPANSMSEPIFVNVLDDSLIEFSETVTITLLSTNDANIGIGSPNTATIFIDDNDSGLVTVSTLTPSVAEESVGFGEFRLDLTHESIIPTHVAYSFLGSAGEGIDYIAPSSATIPAGTLSAIIPISVFNDNDLEGIENIMINLDGVFGHPSISIGIPSSASMDITENEALLTQLTICEESLASCEVVRDNALGNLDLCNIELATCVEDLAICEDTMHNIGEGCSPGGYKQPHNADWWTEPFAPDDPLSEHFDTNLVDENITLLDALNFNSAKKQLGAEKSLLRQAVAAVLNAQNPDVDYPFEVATIIADVNAAIAGDSQDMSDLKEKLSAANSLSCPL